MKHNHHRGASRVIHMARPHYSKCNLAAKPGKVPVEFRCEAAHAEKVCVAGDFNDWRAGELRLERDEDGIWKIELQLAPGRYEYRLIVDGEWQDDPHATSRVPNEFGTSNCVLEVQAPIGDHIVKPAPIVTPKMVGVSSQGHLQHA